MQKKVLSLLLAAAMLLSVSVTPVLAADATVADDSSAAQTVEATADEAAEEVTVIDEVSETAATVNAAAAEETEDADAAEEEVTIIDEVSETAETVDSYTAYTYSDGSYKYTATVLNDCSDSGTFGAPTAKTSNAPYAYNYTITNIVDSSNAGAATYGSGFRGVQITVSGTISSESEGIYFELLDAASNIKGLSNSSTAGNFNYLYLKVGDNEYTKVSAATSVTTFLSYCDAYNTTAGLSGSYESDTYSHGTLIQFFIPWSTFGVSASDVSSAGSYTFGFCILAAALSGNSTANSTYANPLMYDNFGVYTKEEDTSGGDEPEENTTLEDVRDEYNVVVVQDFEDQNSDDINKNNGTIGFSTDYFDNSYSAIHTYSGADQVRLQTNATALEGEGLYFEIESTYASSIALKNAGQFYLYDTVSVTQASVVDGDTQMGDNSNLLVNIAISGASYTVTTISDGTSGTYVYAVMIPWSDLNLTTGQELTYGLSLRFGGSIWSGTIAFDNIGFYGVTETLSASDDSTAAIATEFSIENGFTDSTLYAPVTGSVITANYSTSNYPTTTLTYNGDGYVFAGWYDSNKTACTSFTFDANTTYYAKFVDAAVMMIGFQTTSGASTSDATVTIRLVTTVDSLDYKSVGFTLKIGDWTCDFTTDTVYETITGTAVPTYAATVFSDASLYFVTATVTDIASSAYSDALTVTVYWTTADGTTVTSTLDTSYSGLAITGDGTSVSAIINAANAE